MKKLVLAACVLALYGIGDAGAQGAQTTVTLQFNTPSATGITCTPANGGQFTIPVAAGTVVATCVVSPSTWLGAISINPPNPAFGVNGTQIVVGSSAYNTAGQVVLTLTATP